MKFLCWCEYALQKYNFIPWYNLTIFFPSLTLFLQSLIQEQSKQLHHIKVVVILASTPRDTKNSTITHTLAWAQIALNKKLWISAYIKRTQVEACMSLWFLIKAADKDAKIAQGMQTRNTQLTLTVYASITSLRCIGEREAITSTFSLTAWTILLARSSAVLMTSLANSLSRTAPPILQEGSARTGSR
jgi:hypothetical protein